MDDNLNSNKDLQNETCGRESKFEKCFFCKEENINNYLFSCGHKYCLVCLYRQIFCFYLAEIGKKDILKIKCKCDNGYLEKSIDEIDEIIKEKITIDKNKMIDANEKKIFPKCGVHPELYKKDYCVQCYQNICIKCASEQGNEHHGHRIIPIYRLKKIIMRDIGELPLKFLTKELFEKNLENIGQKIKETSEKNFNETIEKIEDLQNLLNNFKTNYEENYKKTLTKCVKKIKIIKLFFFNFYYEKDLCNTSDEINLLRYINDISNEFMDVEISYNKEINKIANNIKNTIESVNKLCEGSLTFNYKFCDVPRYYKCEDVIQNAHEKLITSIVQLKDERVLSTGYDFQIKIWEDSEKGFNPTHLIKGICGAVSCICLLRDGRFLTGAANSNSIKIWIDDKAGTYEVKQTLTAHNKSVISIAQIKDGRIVSASIDNTLIVWKEENNEFINKQKIEIQSKNLINKLLCLFDSRIAFTLGEKILIYSEKKEDENQEEKFILHQELKKHAIRVKSIYQLKNGNLVSGGGDSQSKIGDHHIVIWKSKTEEPDYFDLFQKLRGHESDVNCIIQLDDDRIASASKDRTIRIWKIDNNVEENGKKFYIINEVLTDYSHGMYCLIQLKNGRLISSSSDNSLILWRNRNGYY